MTRLIWPLYDKTITKIDRFSGQYRFLSNFAKAEVEFEGIKYPTVEHAYQAAKTLNQYERYVIQIADNPLKAKLLGKGVTLRDNWHSMSLQIMEDLILQKFSKHTSLKDQLFLTGDADLEEGNTWGDIFWGTVAGIGENHLGKILMKVRASLKSQISP